MSQTMERPFVGTPPLLWPCNHESSGEHLISRDLCAVRSGNPRVNGKCGSCRSPYRLCWKCARENRRRLVKGAEKGDGLCEDCRNPKPQLVQKPAAPEEKYAPIFPARLPEVVMKPKPAVISKSAATLASETKGNPSRNKQNKRPPLIGVLLADVIDRYREVGAVGVTQLVASRTLQQPMHMIPGIAKCSTLPNDMLALIKEHNLSIERALAIAPFPKAIRPRLADEMARERFPVWRLKRIVHFVAQGKGTWSGLLKSEVGIVVRHEDTLQS